MRTRARLLLAAALVAYATPVVGLTLCTDTLTLPIEHESQNAKEQNAACAKYILRKTRILRSEMDPGQHAVHFPFGTNAVTALCVNGNQVWLASAHVAPEQACPILRRVKGLILSDRPGS